ncbi:MAG: heparan N-sulfatase, partial [Flavobacteriaceae bacterium]
MEDFSGKSWKEVFFNNSIKFEREYIILGKERHDVGRENDKGYPVRSILKNNYFYSINFEPNRWPAGNPETGYLNTDGSPTKSEILNLKRENVNSDFWELAFGKRPKETLYNLKNDPRCMVNIADNKDFMDIKSD